MENSLSTNELNYSLETTPWYFGAYLNMARHNLFLLINHLADKFSYLGFVDIQRERFKDDEDIDKEDHILAQIFNPDRKEFETERFKVYKYLVKRHYLSFIKTFHEKKGKDLDKNQVVDYTGLHNCLQQLFKLVNSFRNSYSHYLAIDDSGNKIEKREKEVTVKTLLIKKEDTVKTLLIDLFKEAREFSLQRFPEFQEKDFNHLEKYMLFEGDTSELTEQGFYFFICLFLERKYAYKFLKKIRGYKNETLPSFKATLQTFTAYSLKVPDERLDSEDRKNELLLDMLNELHRCPKELYNHLSDENKEIFKPQLDDESKQNMLKNTNYEDIPEETIDNLLDELSAQKRYQDRFPYFALRYIEEFNLLPNIRFQIEVGKLNVRSYKKVIDGVNIDRTILKTIKKFGKLSDFEGKEDSIIKLLKNDLPDSEVYFDQYAPHYNLDANKIPFCWLNSENESMTKAWDVKNPTGFISFNDLPKLLMLAYLNGDKVEKNKTIVSAIKNYIRLNQEFLLNIDKLNEIKNKLVLSPENFTKRTIKTKDLKNKEGKTEYLNKDKVKQILRKLHLTENEIIKLSKEELKSRLRNNKKDIEYANQIKYHLCLEQRREELQKHLPTGLSATELPEKVYMYLLNINEIDTSKRIHTKIKSIKEDCTLKLKQLRKECEKKPDEQNLKGGTVATFIARDIINMVIDIEVKNRITPPYYNTLQNRIAYFNISKESIIDLCEELELFNQQKGHAFLNKDLILRSNGIFEFYEKYLAAKIKWIEKQLLVKGLMGGYIIPKDPDKLDKMPYSIKKIKEEIENEDFMTWLNNKAKMPVNLPNSLFDDELKSKLRIELQKKGIRINNTDKFSVLLARLVDNDTQPFYERPRNYKIDGEPKEMETDGLDSKTLKQKYGKYIEQNEKKIRFIQTQDRILMLLCNKILSDMGQDKQDKLQLKDIVPFSETSPLNKHFSFKQTIKRKGNENYFVVIGKDSEEHIKQIEHYKHLQTAEERENYEGAKGYSWKLKDFGRFKRLVKDKRLPCLSSYFIQKEVSFELIDYQLKEYDKYRELVFQKTFELEKYLADKYYDEICRIELSEGKREYNEVSFDIYCKLKFPLFSNQIIVNYT